jgi:hypothetical protein
MDLLDYGHVSEYGAKERLFGPLLSSAVHFLAPFLVDKSYGDVFDEYVETSIFGIK